jgi:hypothetical protein
MSPPARRRRRPNRGGGQPVQPSELWRASGPLPAPDPVVPVQDPTTFLRSLGAPPLPPQAGPGEAYLAVVVHNASRLAVALAAAGDLLEARGEDSLASE